VVASDTFFATHSEQLATLTGRHAMPAIHQSRDFAVAGGLMSYAGSFVEPHSQAGIQTGRILKGEKPADLPVQQVTKVELIVNLKSAKALGLTMPLTAARPRRRGNRINCAMSAACHPMDVPTALANVCYRGKSGLALGAATAELTY
jgi:ABC-type uncharacterized transport system substrate-binding protein